MLQKHVGGYPWDAINCPNAADMTGRNIAAEGRARRVCWSWVSTTQRGTWRPGGDQSITLLWLLHRALEKELSIEKSHRQPGLKCTSQLAEIDSAERRESPQQKGGEQGYGNVFTSSPTKGTEQVAVTTAFLRHNKPCWISALTYFTRWIFLRFFMQDSSEGNSEHLFIFKDILAKYMSYFQDLLIFKDTWEKMWWLG